MTTQPSGVIEKKAINITVDDKTKIYGVGLPELTFAVYVVLVDKAFSYAHAAVEYVSAVKSLCRTVYDQIVKCDDNLFKLNDNLYRLISKLSISPLTTRLRYTALDFLS